jgi:signal transduction histidine kinase
LFSLDLHARAIATHLKRNPAKAEEQIRQVRQITRESLREMRSLIFALRPYSMSEQGLVGALGQLVERERRPNGPEIAFRADGNVALPTDVDVGLFRVTQEALRNAIRHANAERITITLDVTADYVSLRVFDDGQGFDLAALTTDRHGFGLVGLKERVELLGGTLGIISNHRTGTRIEVDVPLNDKKRS